MLGGVIPSAVRPVNGVGVEFNPAQVLGRSQGPTGGRMRLPASQRMVQGKRHKFLDSDRTSFRRGSSHFDFPTGLCLANSGHRKDIAQNVQYLKEK